MKIEYPKDYPWDRVEEMKEKRKLDPIPLDPSSPEYIKVKSEFLDSLADECHKWPEEINRETIKINRIQNYNLYERYYHAKRRIKKKYKKYTKSEKKNLPYFGELLLFHGTSKTHPSLIYNSEEGIDRRYTQRALYGHGSYFAINSGYSCNGSFLYGSSGKYHVLL